MAVSVVAENRAKEAESKARSRMFSSVLNNVYLLGLLLVWS